VPRRHHCEGRGTAISCIMLEDDRKSHRISYSHAMLHREINEMTSEIVT